VFSVSNRTGLVNYLTGNAPEGLFGRTTVPNLCLTVAGPIRRTRRSCWPPDRMREFLALARQHFAFVVIDSPPTLPVTDAAVLGSMVDGVVLCVGPVSCCAKTRARAASAYAWPRLKCSAPPSLLPRAAQELHGRLPHYEAYVASSANGAS